MCRSIVVLRGEEPPGDEEIRAAATQFLRKVSGTRAPSRANADLFDQAVRDVAAATKTLLEGWQSPVGARPPAVVPSRLRAREKRQAAASR